MKKISKKILFKILPSTIALLSFSNTANAFTTVNQSKKITQEEYLPTIGCAVVFK